LARRGLSHADRCPHSDQAEESINHLLLSCVFAREFWFKLLQRVGLRFLAPLIDEEFFDDWWERIIVSVGHQIQKGLNSLVILGAWTLWILRNKCVFDGVSPVLARALLLAREELFFWGLAEARDISCLLALVLV
jgi:hypothetical protein